MFLIDHLAPPIACNASSDQFLSWCAQYFSADDAPTIAAAYQQLAKPWPYCAGLSEGAWGGGLAASRALGDVAIVCPVREAARALRDRWADAHATDADATTADEAPDLAPIFAYHFAHAPAQSINMDPHTLPLYGAFHGAEVPFVFGDQFELSTDAERTLSLLMGCYWRNFIHHGNPSADEGGCVGGVTPPRWPPLAKGEERTMILDTSSALKGSMHASGLVAGAEAFRRSKYVDDGEGVGPVYNLQKTQCDMWKARPPRRRLHVDKSSIDF